MRKLLASLMLIFALSVPVFSGHVPVGGGRYCNCEPVQNVCPCCGGGDLLTVAQENDSISQQDSDGAELGVIRLALMMWLKLKA